MNENQETHTDAPTIEAPTVGRIMWYRPSASDLASGMTVLGEQPLRAEVCYVHSPSCINAVVTDHAGGRHVLTSVIVIHEDEGATVSGFAQWMPYQRQKAVREAIERAAPPTMPTLGTVQQDANTDSAITGA